MHPLCHRKVQGSAIGIFQRVQKIEDYTFENGNRKGCQTQNRFLMKSIFLIYEIVYLFASVIFELLFIGVILGILVSLPMIVTFLVVNNGHHIMDPLLALVFLGAMIALMFGKW
jgi:hypothetical protein